MPPRYAYWTILIGNEPTAFRSGSQEDLMPTLKRIQQRHAEARMMWWQNGKLWNSRLDAQEAMLARGAIGRGRDPRQQPAPGASERRPSTRDGRRDSKPIARSGQREGGLDWKPKGSFAPERSAKPEWKPKGTFTPERPARADWKPKSDWKPRGSGGAAKRPWTPKSHDESRPKDQKFAAEGRESRRSATSPPKPEGRTGKREGGLEWKPKGEGVAGSRLPAPGSREKRQWVPKAEYKKSLGIEAKKDKNWRPGGEHKDPRQKYKDAKKAKWGRFKQTIKKRWESKPGGKKKNE